MCTGILYFHKRVNAYFKTRRIIFLFIKQSPHIFNTRVMPRLLGVEFWSLQQGALALLLRWFFLSVDHRDKIVIEKANWCGMVLFSEGKSASRKRGKNCTCMKVITFG